MEKILPFTEQDRFLLQQNVLLLQQLLSFVFFVIAEKTRVLAHLRRTCRKGREMANARESVSKFGKFLSSMVMPNIGAFIAWGFMTAMFIPTGWFPNKTLAAIASPMLTYLIPILIASQGGYLIAGKRGRIIATIAVMGAIVSGITVDPVTGETTVTTMLMASMLVGPAAGWLIKKFDQLIEGHTPAGFEMLIDNFSLGIGGLVLAIVAYLVIGPLMLGILAVLQAGVQVLMQYSLMPLLAIFIEPAKVLFLNNAINHGIFTPIGLEQVANTGRSLMFLLEANPGPGLGVLLAYCFFCKDETTRQSAPGAVIIHFLGGIHEIYFPYVLMNPTVIIAPIVGNAAAILWFSLAGGGLVAPASPGSVIAILSMTPQGSIITTLVGIALAAGVSFAIASPIVARAEIKSLDEAKDEMGALKGGQAVATDVDKKFGQHVVFACDAHLPGTDLELALWGEHSMRGTPDSRPLDAFEAGEGDYIIPKRRYDAFFGTDLDITLRELGRDTLVVVGFDTNICVLHTLAGAYFLGYRTVVPADATATLLIGTQEGGLEYFSRCYDTRVVTTDDVLAALA